MEPVSVKAIELFLEKLGKDFQHPADLYLLGGTALLLLGNPRVTQDVDYACKLNPAEAQAFQAAIEKIAAEMKLDFELVPLSEFIPLPSGAEGRRRFWGRYGQVEVYLYDLYSIALSKIARGFEADIEDVLFLLRQGLIEFEQLEQLFTSVLPRAAQADIVPQEYVAYFDELKRRWRQ